MGEILDFSKKVKEDCVFHPFDFSDQALADRCMVQHQEISRLREAMLQALYSIPNMAGGFELEVKVILEKAFYHVE